MQLPNDSLCDNLVPRQSPKALDMVVLEEGTVLEAAAGHALCIKYHDTERKGSFVLEFASTAELYEWHVGVYGCSEFIWL